jgi:hypothetical protein
VAQTGVWLRIVTWLNITIAAIPGITEVSLINHLDEIVKVFVFQGGGEEFVAFLADYLILAG